ncbi:MAG: hypothetical protein NPIRA06_29020 [Nitrospirales bacterium]|nr:MAG: hypothetical protein NPIRA06_29020 [Nitrospirales bacterium]
MVTSDFLVIGGGIIGINVARQLKRQFYDATETVIENGNHCGTHVSGRKSGVLHAGFYCSPESLKAKFTGIGNKRLTEYGESKQILMNRLGKLVVTIDDSEHSALDKLLRRGKVNGIDLQAITEEEAKPIEPRVKTYQRALFFSITSTVDPTEALQSMPSDAIDEWVQVRCGV